MSLRFALDQLNPAMRQQAVDQIRKMEGRRSGSIDAEAELAPVPPSPPPSKMRNVRCQYNGMRFDSLKELERWRALEMRQKAGEIRDLRRQVNFDLVVNGILICSYVADHVYEELAGAAQTGRRRRDWRKVVEDVKGVRKGDIWQRFQIKARLMKACHGIEVLVL